MSRKNVIQEFSNYGLFKNVSFLDHFLHIMFLPISELLYFGPFLEFYSLDNTTPELLQSGQFQLFYIFEHSIISIFWMIPEFIHSEPIKEYYVVDHSRISFV